MRHLSTCGGRVILEGPDPLPGEDIAWGDLSMRAEISPHLQLVLSGPAGEVRAPLTTTLAQQHHYLSAQALRVAPSLASLVGTSDAPVDQAARTIGIPLERFALRALHLAPLAPLRPLGTPHVDGWPLIVQRESSDQITLLCTHEMGPLLGLHLHQRAQGPEFHILRTDQKPLHIRPRLRPDLTAEQQIAPILHALNHRSRAGWRRHHILLAAAGLRALTECWWAGRPHEGPLSEAELAAAVAQRTRSETTMLSEIQVRDTPCLHLQFALGPAMIVARSEDLQGDLERLISSARGITYHARREEWRDMLTQMEAMGLTQAGGRPGGVIPAHIVPGSLPATLPRPAALRTAFWPSRSVH